MSFKIQAPPIGQSAEQLKAMKDAAKPTEEKAKADAAKVGRDFEAILVRQMLSQVKIAGAGGYADMATESLATSITAAGGLGLGRFIEHSLGPHAKPNALPIGKPSTAGPAVELPTDERTVRAQTANPLTKK